MFLGPPIIRSSHGLQACLSGTWRRGGMRQRGEVAICEGECSLPSLRAPKVSPSLRDT